MHNMKYKDNWGFPVGEGDENIRHLHSESRETMTPM